MTLLAFVSGMLGAVIAGLYDYRVISKLKTLLVLERADKVLLEALHRKNIDALAESRRQAQYWQDVAGDLAKCCSKTSIRPESWSTIDK